MTAVNPASVAGRLLSSCSPIIVANRAPLTLEEADPILGTPERLVKGSGGLVSAMSTLAQATKAIWVAAARDGADEALAARADENGHVALEDSGASYAISFVHPSKEAYHLYYNRISNPLLWFIHHYLWDLSREPVIDSRTEHAWRAGYVEVNRLFAQRVVEEARAAARPPLIFFQDYQLYLAPEMVRRELPSASLSHFIHVPWPNPAYWRILRSEVREAILTGLLANDVVGFHTHQDVRNFLVTCEDLLHTGVDFGQAMVYFAGRKVHVHAYPLGIDVAEMRAMAKAEKTQEWFDRFAQSRCEQIILRVDRTDLSKNIVRGFLAYERMLEAHYELHGKVQFIAYLQETRQNIDDYRSYLGSVLSAVARINRRFSSGGWMPIHLEIESNIHKAVSLYRQYDVLLVNPIYDGMNLVAKEGPVCNERDGVLVLSENAGAHEELGEFALTVNPFDVDQTAEALYLALAMEPAEKAARADRLRDVVERNDVSDWISAQLSDLAMLATPLHLWR